MKKYTFPLALWLLFETIALALWLTLGNTFYLFNFSYIGTCLALGIALYKQKRTGARNLVQFAVGGYMLIFLGLLSRENMQLEGFWYYLFLGVFDAAVIHYAVAKICGPLLFGRGWCGYACWTAMILDLLPYKTPRRPRRNIGFLRYFVFAGSLLFVGALFVLRAPDREAIMFQSFMIGNALYYAAGIGLAFALQDNRAFCKYLCPVAVFLKPASYFSFFRVKSDPALCIACGKCQATCPMEVDILDFSRSRRNGTECILCLQCVNACPKKALRL